ncbi:hypothetical protein [Mycolicibacterium sp. ND9-15]|uniref:hypothetical protein n=1 Tax=Mycolicibacterium sp. ND9-15 TaxID=3042320 RepID=UPI003FA3D14C
MADVPGPKILELGCGLGGLSRMLLETHPTAEMTDRQPNRIVAVRAGMTGESPVFAGPG